MAGDGIYWAERALNEPYPKQQLSWIGWGVAAGFVGAGLVSFILVASVVTVMNRSMADDAPTVWIAHLDTAMGVQPRGLGERQMAARPLAPVASAARKDQTAGAIYDSKPVLAKATETKAKAKVPAVDKPSERDRTSAKFEPVLAAAQPEVKHTVDEVHAPTAKSNEKKPVDIASGEKLGIQSIVADGIVMLNGRKIRTGSALPNGEVLIATDPTKGMAETDRRVLVVTP